jgi:radical SAM protein with 4Fe4S-binding SPASM domain
MTATSSASTSDPARPDRAWSPPPALCSETERTRRPEPGSPLGRISIEISRECNLRCPYCYASAGPNRGAGLSDREVRAVISEAAECGARLVSIVGGGEPLLRPSLLESGASPVDHANALGCYGHLYTNCTLVGSRAARWLAQRDVSVIGKLNSLREDVQDALTGVPGSARLIRRGIDALLDAGLALCTPSRLGLETVVCRQNYDQVPDLWRFMRSRGIVPEVEIPTLHGRARENREALCFGDDEAPRRYRELFEELLAIDRSEYGLDWTPHPPFAALACRLYYTNCYVNDRGGVQPCAGVDRELGVLRVGPRASQGRPLCEVVSSPEWLVLRRIHEHLGEPCRGCELLGECYGCRGAAFHATGDLFAGDPVCWRRPGCRPASRSPETATGNAPSET